VNYPFKSKNIWI